MQIVQTTHSFRITLNYALDYQTTELLGYTGLRLGMGLDWWVYVTYMRVWGPKKPCQLSANNGYRVRFRNKMENLYNKRRYVCLSVCIYVPYGRPNGWADRDQTWQLTHALMSTQGVFLSRSFMYACGSDRITKHPESDTWWTLLKLRPEDGGGDTWRTLTVDPGLGHATLWPFDLCSACSTLAPDNQWAFCYLLCICTQQMVWVIYDVTAAWPKISHKMPFISTKMTV